MTMRYGFIGLGSLGSALAASLLRAGFDLTLYDIDAAAAKPGRRRRGLGGVYRARSPKGSTPSSPAFPRPPSPSASDRPEGVLAGLKPGATWIEMSTNDSRIRSGASPRSPRKRASRPSRRPVTGGVHGAAAGEITVIVGGEPAVFERHRAALEAMGGRIFHIGPLG